MLVTCNKKNLPNQHGHMINVDRCLVCRGQRPHGGWSSSVVMNGVKIDLRGTTPQVVIHRLQNMLSSNGITYTMNSLWTTLHLDWLSRIDPTYCLVSLDNLLAACGAPPEAEFVGKVEPRAWLQPFLDTLGFFLSVDPKGYEYRLYRGMVECAVRMADPKSAYRLGEHAILVSLLERYSILRYKPCHLLVDAKEWFVGTHNVLASHAGVTSITTATATLKYNWSHETKD